MGGINRHRYPVRINLGRYGAWLLKLYGKRRFRQCIKVVEHFLEAFPDKQYLGQFTEEDIDDWALFMKSKGLSTATISIRLNIIRHFWKWCIEERKMIVLNIAGRLEKRWRDKNPPKRGRKAKTLSYDELRVIIEQIVNERVKEFIYLYLIGATAEDYKMLPIIRDAFRHAALKAGLDYFWRDFTHSISELRCRVLQNLDSKLRDTFGLKAEDKSHSFGAIHLAPLDEGATVINRADNSSAIEGISEFKSSEEGK